MGMNAGFHFSAYNSRYRFRQAPSQHDHFGVEKIDEVGKNDPQNVTAAEHELLNPLVSLCNGLCKNATRDILHVCARQFEQVGREFPCSQSCGSARDGSSARHIIQRAISLETTAWSGRKHEVVPDVPGRRAGTSI